MSRPDEVRDVVADALGERRRGAAGRDADHDRVAPDDRGQDEAAELGIVGDVAQPGDRRDLGVHRAVVRRGDDEESIRRIVGLERPQQLGDREPPQLVVDLRRDDRDPCVAVEQALHLLRRDPPAADDEAVAAAQVEAGHVVAHVATLVTRAPVPSRRTVASSPSASIETVNAPGATAAIFTASIRAPARAWSADVTSRALSDRTRPRGKPAQGAQRRLLSPGP